MNVRSLPRPASVVASQSGFSSPLRSINERLDSSPSKDPNHALKYAEASGIRACSMPVWVTRVTVESTQHPSSPADKPR